MENEKISRPRHPTICRVLRRTGYGKCFLCTVLIFLSIFYASYCHFKYEAYSSVQPLLVYQHGPCALGYNFVPIIFGLMLYIVYIMECWHSRSKIIGMKKVRVEDAMDYIAALKDSPPIIWWKSICYHYMRKSRQITRYRNGDAVPATQIYYERINTHTSANIFAYEACGYKDISKSVKEMEKFTVTRMRLNKSFLFANMQAAGEFEEQRTRFFNENELKDDYMEVLEGMDLTHTAFFEELLVFNCVSPPWFLHPLTYWLCSVLLFSWPIRIFAEWRTAILPFHVVKLFGTNYLSPSAANYTGLLTRTSTMETADLEALLSSDRRMVVPSYSEAMLLQDDPLVAPLPPHPPPTISTFIYPKPLPVRDNEHAVLRNYGAVEASPFTVAAKNFSRSMSFHIRDQLLERVANIPTRPRTRFPTRSFSLAGISSGWSVGYHRENEDEQRLIDEPPPPYDTCYRPI